MDRRIRNIDERALRALKAKAADEGKTIDEALNEAMEAYARWPWNGPKTESMREAKTRRFGTGSERLSERVDEVAYGL